MGEGEATVATATDVEAAAQKWHASTTDMVVEEFATDPGAGLSTAEAARRLEEHGPNELVAEVRRGAFAMLLAQFVSPLITILLVAFGVAIAIGELTDAGVIAAVLVINATIGFVQERKAERSVEALAKLAAPRSTVVRDGHVTEVDAAGLVPGDIVQLQSGTRVPADLRLFSTTTLDIDESLLTGESTPVRKTTEVVAADALAADRVNVAFMGAIVTSGRGRGIVVATASDTQLGTIAERIREQRRPVTPLQQRMKRFANIIASAVLASTAVVFVLGLALGEPADQMLLTAIALAVAVVPEGLPVALTVALALGVRRMAQRNAIIRSLPAVETLGSTDVIGSDKTGTLTENRMTVVEVWTPEGGRFRRDDPVDDLAEGVREVLASAILSSEAEVEIADGEIVDRRGDPTEVALLVEAVRVGQDPGALRTANRQLAAVPFESAQRYSYVVVDDDGPVLHLKGAPERVIELCASAAGTDLDRDAVLNAAEEMAARGLRVLATARRPLDVEAASVDAVRPPQPGELELTGLVGMYDPPRKQVPEAVERCQNAGIRVVMITGDHAATGRAIATELAIADADARVLTGAEVETMTDEELFEVVTDVDVYARVSPEHKLRITRALQSHGAVVAVTGDGVNDGPALKAADIGVAMGRSGTDVAREASDMVLTDDNFVSIASAVEEGRVVFDNVRKVTYFLMSTGVAAIVAITASTAAGLPLPYVPAALLWLNVVTNGLQDVALAFERAEPDVLRRQPRRRAEPIVSGVLWERAVLTGVTMAIGSLWLFVWAMEVGMSDAQQRGVALTTLVIAMAVHAYNARSETRSIAMTRLRGNRFLLISTVVATMIHLAASAWAPTQHVLQIAPVPAVGWPRIAAVALAVILVSELHKAGRSRRRVRPAPG